MIDATQLAFTIAVATLIILILIFIKTIRKSEPENQFNFKNETEQEPIKETQKAREKKINLKNLSKSKETVFKHDWLSTSLKAHSDTITGIDFSSNGKYLLSCGNDRAVFLWSTKEFEMHQHRNFRCNVEFDHALKVRFSPDSKSFIAGLGNANTIRAYKISKKEDSSIQIVSANIEDFPQKHKTNLINIGISCNAKYIMTCSKDTTFNVWNLKGGLLASIDTILGNNNYACISPCGRFIGVCGFTPDVKIWEVLFDKTDNFKEVRRAFELKGHSAGIYGFAFNSDSSRMVSVSKDKTWRLWDTKIDYERGQDASLMLTVPLGDKGPSLIAISGDSYSVAVTVNTKLFFFNGLTGECDQVIEDVFKNSVCEIAFSNDNNYLAVAGDRHVKIFRNITGHKSAIQDLETQLKTVKTQSAKERIEQLIEQHRKFIENVSQN